MSTTYSLKEFCMVERIQDEIDSMALNGNPVELTKKAIALDDELTKIREKVEKSNRHQKLDEKHRIIEMIKQTSKKIKIFLKELLCPAPEKAGQSSDRS